VAAQRLRGVGCRRTSDLLKMPLLHDERQLGRSGSKQSAWRSRYRSRARYSDASLSFQQPSAGSGVALRAQRSSKRNGIGTTGSALFPGACLRGIVLIVYPPRPVTSGKIQVFQEWLLGRSDLSNERTPSSLRALGGMVYVWNPPAPPSFHAAFFRATINALAHHCSSSSMVFEFGSRYEASFRSLPCINAAMKSAPWICTPVRVGAICSFHAHEPQLLDRPRRPDASVADIGRGPCGSTRYTRSRERS